MDAASNRDKVERAIALFNAGDVDGYLAMYAENAAVHGVPPEFEPTLEGLRQYAAANAGLHELRWRTDDVIAEGDRVVLRGRFSATHSDAVLGAPPTGKRVEWEMITIYRFGSDGRVAERWMQNDRIALLRQLGISSI